MHKHIVRLTILLAFHFMPNFALSAESDACYCDKCGSGEYEVFAMSSTSMLPNLPTGSCFIVKNIQAQDQLPSRGAIVAFDHPVKGNRYVSRLIGLPGDQIQIRHGYLHINGEKIPVKPKAPYKQEVRRLGAAGIIPRCPEPTGIGGTCNIERFEEILPNGTKYDVLNMSQWAGDNTGVYTVPSEHFFVLGDHRDNSTDSRIPQKSGGLGFIHASKLRGVWHAPARNVSFESEIPKRKLFRKVTSGETLEHFFNSPEWSDCSQEGIKTLCLEGQSFLKTNGTLNVVFQDGYSVRAVFESGDLSLFQNALTLFSSEKYAPCMLENHNEAIDLVSLLQENGVARYDSRMSELQTDALSTGYLSITFAETNIRNIFNYETCPALSASLQPDQRLITVTALENFLGATVAVTFDLNAIEQAKLLRGLASDLQEDF